VLGSHDRGVRALAVLPDGRVVSGGRDRQVLLWDPGDPGSPGELGSHDGWVRALALLPDGRVVSGGGDGRVLLWNPAELGSPGVLGSHDDWVRAVAVPLDGRVVSAGDDGRVLLWDVMTQTRLAQLSCSAKALAVGPSGRDETTLVVAHAGAGLSFWSIAARQTA
jgi:WD40 repeat protein